MADKLLHSNITEKILQSFYTVNKILPYGILADIYGNAIAIEFEHNKLKVEKNYLIELKYRNITIGNLYADFLIEDKVLVKIVSVDNINKQIEDDSKLLLRSSIYEVCMILNTLGDYEYKRIIFTNDYKKIKE